VSSIKQKHNTICGGHHYAQANTNNVSKTRALLQTTGGKDESNIVSMRTSQHGTQNVKTFDRRKYWTSHIHVLICTKVHPR
jgi:hypothetical protein